MAVISVVVPVYKAENSLKELYRRLKSSLESLSNNFEIILVEDCGGDRSWTLIQELAKEDHRVKGIQFSRNFGQHYGITAGIDACDGDWIVVMDCDLQERPEDIPKLYQKALEGYDVVLARRMHRKHHIFYQLGARLFYRILAYFSEVDYDSNVGNFRIISRKVADQYRAMREQARFFGGQIQWLGFPTTSIEVEHDKRYSGKSTYTLNSLWKLATTVIVAHSDKPLRLAIRVGFFISFVAACFGIYIFIRALYYQIPVMGWSSLIVSLYFLGGLLLAFQGIMGIYLGRTFDEVKKRPLYVIRQKTF